MSKKILSIDCDYFIDGNEQVIKEMFKTCDEEIPHVISNHYSFIKQIRKQPEVLNLKLNTDLINQVLSRVLKLNAAKTILYIADSHEHIKMILDDDLKENFFVHNIDYHHDFFYGDHKKNIIRWIDDHFSCANWAGYMDFKHRMPQYVWIHRNGSETSSFVNETARFSRTTDLSVLDDVDFDYVFICKSSAWVPPFLDDQIDKLINMLYFHFENAKFHPDDQLLNRVSSFGFNKKYYKNILDNYNKGKSEMGL